MKRVKPLVASLYQSDSERLRWLAKQSIGYVPGIECVDIVLDDLVEGGHDLAWRALDHWRRPKETAARVAALVDLGSKKYSVWGQQAMWRALKMGECFEEACIEKALAALDRLEALEAKTEKLKAENSERGPMREEGLVLAAVLGEYLAAAKTSRDGATPMVMTAAAYRKWFRDHPAKKKAEAE